MKCHLCDKKAIFKNPSLCKEHFITYFENKVKKTIKDYDLLRKDDKIIVAASGGKDSLTVLFLLKKLGYNVDALLIDEGIKDYREHTKKDLINFCKKQNIELKIVSFKSIIMDLDDLVNIKGNPCTICGLLRRYLLNKYSKDYDKIVTGHNADDESQSIIMNFLRNNKKQFFNNGPKTNLRKGFTQRIKPLYFCTEKEIMTYAIINNLTSRFTECPYVIKAFRAIVRDLINDFSLIEPAVRNNILTQYLFLKEKYYNAFLNKVFDETKFCSKCGAPSNKEICSVCELIKELNIKSKNNNRLKFKKK